MAVYESQINESSEKFQRNAERMQAAVDELRAIEQAVINAADAKASRYTAKGYLTPRERLKRLLDPGAPFFELSSIAGYLQDGDADGSGAGAFVITGIGYIAGVRCAVTVDNYLAKGGMISTLGSAKRLRLQTICLENKLPLVTLAQSGGGNLKSAGDIFGPSGVIFANQARLSAAGIPQITVVHGSATAGGAYQPGLSDYIIMVRRQSTMYLAGPPLLKAATGEVATDEEIGGAELHTGISGVADYLAENDADGIRIARDIVSKLAWHPEAKSSAVPVSAPFKEPLYDPETLIGIVPTDPKTPYDVREIITRVADGSRFLDFKPEYDSGTVCGHIELQGHPCGVVGNNGPITANGAAKAGQFIQLCDQSGTPILFLHNITGFLVGTESERAGIIKHGSKLIQAVTNARVPKISVVVGGSYGAGNYAMCGRGMNPRFMFAWPRSVVSVMGPAQAGSVLRQVAEARMQRDGVVDEEELERIERETREAMEERSHAVANTARLWDDGIIDPRDTRKVLGFFLSICREAGTRTTNTNSFGVARF